MSISINFDYKFYSWFYRVVADNLFHPPLEEPDGLWIRDIMDLKSIKSMDFG